MNVSMKPRETTLNFTAAGGSPVKSVKATQEPLACIPVVTGGPNYYGSGEPVIKEIAGILTIIINPDISRTYWLYLYCSKTIDKSNFIIRMGNNVCGLVEEEVTENFVAYRCTTSFTDDGTAWRIEYKGSPFCNISFEES